MTKECKTARNSVLIPVIILLSLLMFLGSCTSTYQLCPAYGNNNTSGNVYSCQR